MPFEIAAWLALVAGVLAGVSALVVALSRVRPADRAVHGGRRREGGESGSATVPDRGARPSAEASPSTARETAAAER